MGGDQKGSSARKAMLFLMRPSDSLEIADKARRSESCTFPISAEPKPECAGRGLV